MVEKQKQISIYIISQQCCRDSRENFQVESHNKGEIPRRGVPWSSKVWDDGWVDSFYSQEIHACNWGAGGILYFPAVIEYEMLEKLKEEEK